jgi:hypothetical protein
MTRELWRRTDEVVVPDVVGMALSEARQIAFEAGVVLAQPDPGGPPLGALTWPGEYVVTSQDPPPGARLWRWDAVAVTWSALDRQNDGDSSAEPSAGAGGSGCLRCAVA